MFVILITILLTIVSMYFAGCIAQSRGRSSKIWLWIAAFIGPFALLLVFLLPNLQGQDGNSSHRA
jgi:NO-binding membrane sensor protein with MHYT domain